MRFVFLFIVTISLFGAMAPANAEQLRPKLDDIVEHFLKVVFGKEYNFATLPPIISKWTDSPVNIILQGLPKPKMVEAASRHLGIISKLTKIKFQQGQPQDLGPSIDLIFLKRSQMGKINVPGVAPKYIQGLAADPTMVCYFLSWHQPDERIIKAIVVINNQLDPRRIGSCLLEELTQVMGLPNDAKAYWKTLFNPTDVSFQHSPWDMLYLKTLYDPRLIPGMTAKQARPVVREIFKKALGK